MAWVLLILEGCSPVCAMRATFFRADRNVWVGARKFRVIVKDCPLLKVRCWELMALVWCSSLFSAAWKSQLLMLRACPMAAGYWNPQPRKC